MDKVLSAVPNHPDSVALRGLILYESGRKDEGRELTREALVLGKSSFFVWDIRSRLLEADGDIAEAAAAMKMCLLVEKDTDRVREMRVKLGMAQFVAQDYVGFLETRTQILNAAPEEARSWAPCAIAAQFMGDFPTAIALMDQYIASVRNDLPPQELSELLFYKVELLIESGDKTAALAALDREEEHLVEKRRWRELRVQLLLERVAAGDNEAASAASKLALELLDLNTEDSRYREWLARARGAAGNVDGLFSLYSELQQRYPRSAGAKRALLDFLPASDTRFLPAFLAYYRPLLEKGAPSCFASLKSIYGTAEKVAVVEKQVLADLAALREGSHFAGSSEKTPPSTFLWCLYFAAQHYDRLSQWPKALELINEALLHTCTLQELYIAKARICKHMGDLNTAFLLTDRARQLDTADRWLNSISVRYALAAGKIAEADARMGIFARAEEGVNNVFDMQNQRYMLALGMAYLREREYGKGLKVLLHFLTVYNQLVTDHCELLRFSMGAGTASAWAAMGRYMRSARSAPAFVSAISACIATYLLLYRKSGKADAPPELSVEELEKQWAAMSPKTRKKAKQDYRRNQEKQTGAAAKSETGGVETRSQTQRSILYMRGDTDPVGDGLLELDPLQEAYRLSQILCKGAPERIETHLLAGQVAVFRGKLVQALAFLGKALSMDASHPQIQLLAASVLNASPNNDVRAVVDEARPKLLGGCSSVEDYIGKMWQSQQGKGKSVGVLTARLQVEVWLLKRDPISLEPLLKECIVQAGDVDACLDLLALLGEIAPVLVEPWKKHCVATLPGSAFGGASVPTPELDLDSGAVQDEI